MTHARLLTKTKLRVAVFLALTEMAGGCACSASSAEQPVPRGKNSREVRHTRTDWHGDPLPAGAIARLGTVRLRHEYQFLPPCDFYFTPDRRTLASARNDKVVQFWDVKTGKPLREFRHETGFRTFVLSANGKVLAIADFQNVTVWDVSGKKPLRKIRTEGDYPIAAASDGQTLASSMGKTIRLWDTAAGKEKRRLSGHTNNIQALLFSSDGKTLVSADDSDIRFWDVSTGREFRKIAVGGSSSIALSPDGAVLASGGSETVKNTREARLYLWDAATGQRLRQLRGPQNYVPALAFSPDGKTLAGAEYETIYLWDAATGEEIRRIEKAGSGLNRLAFSPDGKSLASAGPGNTVLRLWEVATGKPLHPPGPDGPMASVAFSPDGRFIATGSWAGHTPHLHLWDAATGKPLWECREIDMIHRLFFTPDGKGIIASIHDGTIRLWDVGTGKEIRQYPLPDGRSSHAAIALSSDGTKLTLLHSRLSITWDVRTGKPSIQRYEEFHPLTVSFVAFSPDAATVAEPYSKGLRLWKTATGQSVLTLEHPRMERPTPRGGEIREEAAAFSPDGRTLAASTVHYCLRGPFGSTPGEWAIHLWDLGTGKVILRISGGENQFKTLAFAPDGRTLASAGKGVIQLWEAITGKELLAYRRQEASVMTGALAFSPDNTRLVAGYADATAIVWDLTPGIHRGGMPKKDLTRRDLDQLWSDLASEDAAKAYAAVWALVAVPGRALPFLKEPLKPVETVDPRHIRRLLTDLDSAEFTVREAAVKELTGIGEQAEVPLREALANKPSLEVRRRIEALLARPDFARPPEWMRRLRAIQVLEQIGTPEARRLLEDHAQGAPAARATRDAKAALQRLARRTAATPP